MGNKEDFQSLINEYHPVIYKICRVYSTDEDFDDLYQEILIGIWKSLKSFEGRSKISTWLYRVALNTALTYQRGAKKQKENISIDQVAPLVDSHSPSNEKKRQVENLYKAIQKLKKDDRSIILLYLEENSYEGIAEIAGITVSNVGVKINRIKKRLFQILNSTENG